MWTLQLKNQSARRFVVTFEDSTYATYNLHQQYGMQDAMQYGAQDPMQQQYGMQDPMQQYGMQVSTQQQYGVQDSVLQQYEIEQQKYGMQDPTQQHYDAHYEQCTQPQKWYGEPVSTGPIEDWKVIEANEFFCVISHNSLPEQLVYCQNINYL